MKYRSQKRPAFQFASPECDNYVGNERAWNYLVCRACCSHTLTTNHANHRRIDRCAQLRNKIWKFRKNYHEFSLLITIFFKYVRNFFLSRSDSQMTEIFVSGTEVSSHAKMTETPYEWRRVDMYGTLITDYAPPRHLKRSTVCLSIQPLGKSAADRPRQVLPLLRAPYTLTNQLRLIGIHSVARLYSHNQNAKCRHRLIRAWPLTTLQDANMPLALHIINNHAGFETNYCKK